MVTIMLCNHCHWTPKKDFSGPVGMNHMFSGGHADGDAACWAPARSFTANITSDPETGIGKWTEEQIVTARQDDEKPDGKMIQGPMLFMQGRWAQLEEQDLKASRLHQADAADEEQGAEVDVQAGPPPAGAGSGSAGSGSAGSGSASSGAGSGSAGSGSGSAGGSNAGAIAATGSGSGGHAVSITAKSPDKGGGSGSAAPKAGSGERRTKGRDAEGRCAEGRQRQREVRANTHGRGAHDCRCWMRRRQFVDGTSAVRACRGRFRPLAQTWGRRLREEFQGLVGTNVITARSNIRTNERLKPRGGELRDPGDHRIRGHWPGAPAAHNRARDAATMR